MRERCVVLGSSQSLHGVVTEPLAAESNETKPAVLLLNAGLLHRVGPNRLYVNVARRLAASGFLVLRFDFSGLGDSEARHDKLPVEQAAVSETVEAMDFLSATYRVDRFLLIGLCSGADHAFRAATVDARVVGANLIDFYYEPTLGYYLDCYSKLIFSQKRWSRLVTGKSHLWRGLWGLFARYRKAKGADQERAIAEKEKSIEGFRALADREVDLFAVFTADGPAHYQYRKYFARKVSSALAPSNLRVEVVAGTDHVFTGLASQRLLVNSIDDWAGSAAAKLSQSRTVG